ncbi:MAG: transporter, partial [Variovorax sp.]|nr:transporter [Variovorax sp.]
AAWARAGRDAPADRGAATPARGLPWLQCFTNRSAWLLAMYFGLINGGYTSLVAWLPHFYAQQGSTPQQAGAMLALMTVAQVVAALAMPVLARGRRDLRPWLFATLAAQLAGFAGLGLNAPGAAGIVALLGFGLGGSFALCMVLALDHLSDPRQAGTLAAFMQGLGFMIAALAPFVTGWVREQSGSFGFVWAYLGAIVLVLLPLTLCFDPRRYARATGGLFGARTPPPAPAPAAVAD